MTNPQHARRLVVVALLTCAIVSGAPLPARAAGVSCSYLAADRRVDATVEEANLALARDGQGRILFGIDQADAQCGAATVTNTNRIVVNGSSGNDTLTILRSGGEFAPGADVADEAPGIAELEFTVNLRGGVDRFVISGGIGNRTLVFGTATLPFRRVALNDDDDGDITFLGAEELVGITGEGDDRLSARGGNGAGTPLTFSVFLDGRGGRDAIVGGLARDFVNGGRGLDTIDGAEGNDLMDGGPGTDTTIGGPDNDELFSAEAPGDTFVPGPGIDLVSGSAAGGDTVSYATASGPVNVNLGAGEATGEGDDILSSIEHVAGSDLGDTLSGNAVKNTLVGRGGGDLLQGAQEADTLSPGPGIDDVRGGAGLDTVSYLDSNVPVVVDLGAGTATAQGDDNLVLVENALGTQLRDVLTGSTGPNVLSGFFGADELTGLEGDDTLDGGADPDDIDGGPGTDVCSPESAPGSTISCEEFLAFVGTHDLKPRNATVEPGERITYRLAWTHPHRWRRLDTVELRVRDGARVLTWVRWNQEGNTFQLFDPRDGGFTRRHDAGSDTVLTSTFARLFLRGSDAEALGPRTILVRMRLSFRRSAIGEHVVEVTAEDDRGRRDPWQRAGGLRVAR